MNAIYLRTSTQDQTPELQLKDILSICPEDYTVFTEQASAWKENSDRPEFEKIKSLIAKGQVKNLYCWDLDRLYRNRTKLKEFFVLCKAYGCKIWSFRQGWMQDINNIPAPFNEIVSELLINITGWMAEDESNKKSDRIRNAMRTTEYGTFSYKGNAWGRKPISIHAKNKILELHQQGLSIRKIAEQVMVYDKNNNGKPVSKSTVQLVIKEGCLIK